MKDDKLEAIICFKFVILVGKNILLLKTASTDLTITENKLAYEKKMKSIDSSIK